MIHQFAYGILGAMERRSGKSERRQRIRENRNKSSSINTEPIYYRRKREPMSLGAKIAIGASALLVSGSLIGYAVANKVDHPRDTDQSEQRDR